MSSHREFTRQLPPPTGHCLSRMFEALGHADTPGGTIRLWRRHDPGLDLDVYEVKLGDEYLMTSLLPDSEIALATVGLGEVPGDGPLDVVVGGLGLGFTAHAVLEDPRVSSLVVVEFTQAVIDWHEQELVPGAAELMADPRARLVQGDFFAMAQGEDGGDGLDPLHPGRRFHAVLVDIDHTPVHQLDDLHGHFYTPSGLTRLADRLHPGGVFGLWSDGPPLDHFTGTMREVFDDVDARVVTFANVVTRGTSSATIYVGRRRG